MSKKINKALLPNLKEKINEVRIIPIEIDGEIFEVTVNVFLSGSLRDKLIKHIQTYATEENVEKYGGEVLAFYSIFHAITDIEFSEDIEEGIDLFNSLSDLGVIAQIVNQLPEQLFHDITRSLEMTQEVLEQMARENEVS